MTPHRHPCGSDRALAADHRQRPAGVSAGRRRRSRQRSRRSKRRRGRPAGARQPGGSPDGGAPAMTTPSDKAPLDGHEEQNRQPHPRGRGSDRDHDRNLAPQAHESAAPTPIQQHITTPRRPGESSPSAARGPGRRRSGVGRNKLRAVPARAPPTVESSQTEQRIAGDRSAAWR